MSLRKPNRFLDRAKENLEGAAEDPTRAPLDRVDVDGKVRYEGDRAIEVEAFGEKLAVGDQGLVRAKNGVFQLVKLDGRDYLIPTF
jgi:hypothetical protein